MPPLAAMYAQRKRQATVVLIVGAFALVVSLMTVRTLPNYINLSAASDAASLTLAGQVLPLIGNDVQSMDDLKFMLARSGDGTTFAPPTARRGYLRGLAAKDGRCYALFLDRSTLSLGADAGNWQSIPWTLDWQPSGLVTLDNAVTALGQSADRKAFLTATLDNGTWRPGASLDHACDNAEIFLAARSRDVEYLVWAEVIPPASSSGRNLSRGDLAMLPLRIGLARVIGATFEPLPKLELAHPVSFSVVGDNDGIHVFFKEITGVSPLGPSFGPVLSEATFADGRWGEPRAVALSEPWWRRSGDITPASFQGRTYLFTAEYALGALYVGTWGRERRGGEWSRPFLAIAPTDDDLSDEIRWALMAVAGAFITAGAAVGFVLARRADEEPKPREIVYATVTDRATAAMLDLAVIWGLMHLMPGEASAVQIWLMTVVGYFVYGTVFESIAGGQTLAKKVLGLRVLDADSGKPPAFQAAFGRNLFKFLDMLTLGAGVCLATRRFQRPGDLLAGTVVVKEFPSRAQRED